MLTEQKSKANGDKFLGKKTKRRARHGKNYESDFNNDDDIANDAKWSAGASNKVPAATIATMWWPLKRRRSTKRKAPGALRVQSGKSCGIFRGCLESISIHRRSLPDWFAKDEMLEAAW